MPSEPAEADMADYRITFRNPGLIARMILAAYVAPDEKHPDMLVLKDSQHRTVYMVSREELLEVQRLEPAPAAGTEILEDRPWKM